MERKQEIRANCSNCEYVTNYHTDPIRLERCKVFRISGKFKSLPTNPRAMESVLNGNKGLCEKYQSADDLVFSGTIFFYD